MKILVLDNYDSFVYNLVHLLRELGQQPEVYRNNKISLDKIARFDKILLSPGPGVPHEAGIMPDLLKEYAPQKSILGVCLGHQAIGEAFGGTLINLPTVLHGVTSQNTILDRTDSLFQSVPERFKIGHYHSWVIDRKSIAGKLKITSEDTEGNVMAVSHPQYDVKGLQFHPESILTEYGRQIIQNWLAF
jgi:anthranilate synthase component 2